METGNVKFLKNGGVSGSEGQHDLGIKEITTNTSLLAIKEIQVNIPLPINVHSSIVVPNIATTVVECFDNNEQHLNDDMPNEETNP